MLAMTYVWWSVVIGVTSGVLMLGIGYVLRGGRDPLDRLRPVAPGPRGVVMLPRGPVYGPFPVDTGPLLIWSGQRAAEVALEREIRQLGDVAEAKIPARWR